MQLTRACTKKLSLKNRRANSQSSDLNRNSSSNAVEEVAEITRNGTGQHSEWIVGATTGNDSEECKEEHVSNDNRNLHDLTK